MSLRLVEGRAFLNPHPVAGARSKGGARIDFIAKAGGGLLRRTEKGWEKVRGQRIRVHSGDEFWLEKGSRVTGYAVTMRGLAWIAQADIPAPYEPSARFRPEVQLSKREKAVLRHDLGLAGVRGGADAVAALLPRPGTRVRSFDVPLVLPDAPLSGTTVRLLYVAGIKYQLGKAIPVRSRALRLSIDPKLIQTFHARNALSPRDFAQGDVEMILEISRGGPPEEIPVLVSFTEKPPSVPKQGSIFDVASASADLEVQGFSSDAIVVWLDSLPPEGASADADYWGFAFSAVCEAALVKPDAFRGLVWRQGGF